MDEKTKIIIEFANAAREMMKLHLTCASGLDDEEFYPLYDKAWKALDKWREIERQKDYY